MDLRIALRGVSRNKRRSAMTLLTVAVGAVAVLIFGAFIVFLARSVQTGAVQRTGHLALYKQGFTQWGAADPLGYNIPNYQEIIALLRNDAEIGPDLAVITPTQIVFGVAGNELAGTSKTFYGLGVIREDQYRMERWNEYQLPLKPLGPPIKDTEIEKGDIGIGLARMLRLCDGLKVPNCSPMRAPAASPAQATVPAGPDSQFSALLAQDREARASGGRGGRNRVDLLSPTTTGAPNVVSMYAVSASNMGSKDVDDNLVKMSLPLAQRLVYGRHAPAVSSIVLQLKSTSQLAPVQRRLSELEHQAMFHLEAKTFEDLVPLYGQALKFLGMIFVFISIIIAVIVLFSVVNTMGMSVMERTTEIGTMRALGSSKFEISAQFVTEGVVLGLLGSMLGAAMAWLISVMVNAANLKWSPPTSIEELPLKLLLVDHPQFVLYTCAALTALAALASVVPARRAALMDIGDALRHV